MKRNKNNIRQSGFWHSDLPLTSKRVRRILSNPDNSRKLVDAIIKSRENDLKSRTNSRVTFTIENE